LSSSGDVIQTLVSRGLKQEVTEARWSLEKDQVAGEGGCRSVCVLLTLSESVVHACVSAELEANGLAFNTELAKVRPLERACVKIKNMQE
jgi:hypothetical protein